MKTNLFPETLSDPTAQVLKSFFDLKPDFLASFYLSGGTALALQLGHRESEDLDFFSTKPFSPQEIEQELLKFGSLSETELAQGTLNTFLRGVKLQFLEYPYPLLEPLVPWRTLKLSSLIDLACTKLQTIGMRGSKKDFIDIYFLLKKYSLPDLLAATKRKYRASDYSETHILKSLIYFVDAEEQPDLKMHQNVSWEDLKNTITTAVKAIDLS
ncbi:MAG: nucleotidyl transferase AbiEii/AbiGii toxin family protein [Patescibacteria group bacterium]